MNDKLLVSGSASVSFSFSVSDLLAGKSNEMERVVGP